MEKCSACGAPLSEGVCPYCGAGRQQAAVDGMGKTGSQPQVVVNNIGVQPGQGIDVPPKTSGSPSFSACSLAIWEPITSTWERSGWASFTFSPSGWPESAG